LPYSLRIESKYGWFRAPTSVMRSVSLNFKSFCMCLKVCEIQRVGGYVETRISWVYYNDGQVIMDTFDITAMARTTNTDLQQIKSCRVFVLQSRYILSQITMRELFHIAFHRILHVSRYHTVTRTPNCSATKLT
jgi:hypothetical protein